MSAKWDGFSGSYSFSFAGMPWTSGDFNDCFILFLIAVCPQ